MYQYLKGIIEEKTLDTIVVDVRGVGYLLFVGNSSNFPLNEEVKVYCYHHVREDGIALFGFINKEAKELFLKLNSVNGLGPKTITNAISACKVSELIQAIELGNVAFLKKLPGIGPKTANQIILDLKGKLVETTTEEKNITSIELKDAYDVLISLNYKASAINPVLKKLGQEKMTTQEYIKKALQQLGRGI